MNRYLYFSRNGSAEVVLEGDIYDNYDILHL